MYTCVRWIFQLPRTVVCTHIYVEVFVVNTGSLVNRYNTRTLNCKLYTHATTVDARSKSQGRRETQRLQKETTKGGRKLACSLRLYSSTAASFSAIMSSGERETTDTKTKEVTRNTGSHNESQAGMIICYPDVWSTRAQSEAGDLRRHRKRPNTTASVLLNVWYLDYKYSYRSPDKAMVCDAPIPHILTLILRA